MAGYQIRSLKAAGFAETIGSLSELLIDSVAGGASVSFMYPLAPEKARAYWQEMGQSLARGERTIIVAERDDGRILGSVQLITAQPENQPHRADVAKLLVHRDARRQGIAMQLMAALEKVAQNCGKTLLLLDTATGSEAELFYQNAGWQRAGEVPCYALMPNGALCGTSIYYRDLNQPA